MPGSVVVVTYRGSPIEGVLFRSTSFTRQINAVPGTCEVHVRDPEAVLSFVTGGELVCTVGETPVWGGYITRIVRTHFFPDTVSPEWVLYGVDYNIVFDKRVVRFTPAESGDANSYLKPLPLLVGSDTDGFALAKLVDDYADMSDFDTSEIDAVSDLVPGFPAKAWAYVAQGSKVRQQFEAQALVTGAIYYIEADKKVHYHAIEDTLGSWGFSDQPDNVTTFPFRELQAVEDGSVIVNDALIWGGSQFADAAATAGEGGTVFFRTQDATSQTNHGRWQVGETHFGEEGFGIDEGVEARANAIVLGPPGADALNALKGLRYPQWQFTFSWLHNRVPGFIVPGTIVDITLNVFSITQSLPLRSVRISFPDLDEDGNGWVRYEGEFSLMVSDPYSLWGLLMGRLSRSGSGLLGAAQDGSAATVFGAYGSFTPTLVSGLTYTLPFGYVSGTLLVYANGLLQTPGTDFTESDPLVGEFAFVGSAPTGPYYATCRTLSS